MTLSKPLSTIVLALVHLFLTHSSSWAVPLTLDQVIASVNASYPLILGAKQDVEKNTGDFLSARGGFDPVLKSYIQDIAQGYYKNTLYEISIEQPTPLWGARLVTGFKKGVGNFAVYDSRSRTFDQGEWKAGVELPLLKGGWTDERRTRIQNTEVGVQASEQALVSKQLEIRREAARKYWDWVAAGLKRTIAKELLDIALERDQALLKRVTQGDAAKIDQTDNQRAVLQRQAGLVSATRALQKATLELSLYYRNLQGVPILVDEDQLPPRFPNPEKPHQDPSPQLDQISMQYPETRLLGLQLKQVEFDQSLAKNQLLPKLDLGIAYAKDFGVNPGTTYIQPTQYPTELRAYLVFELPLLLRTPRGRLSAVHAQQEKLSLIRDLTRDRIKTQIMDLSQSITAALNRIHYTHQEVELSQKLEEAERKRFLHGDSSLLIINIREQTTRDAMNKEIDALSDYFKSKAEYETFIQPPQENPLVTQGS